MAALTRRTPIICIGDSHIEVFLQISSAGLLPRLRIEVCPVRGATAQGLANPNSQTDGLAVFTERIARAPVWQHLVFQLGEVDCGFLIWYRAAKHGLTVEQQLANSLANYLDFLDRIPFGGSRRVFVLSAPLPTILDDQSWGDVATARREVTASLRERTALTLEYNRALEAATAVRKVEFLDVTSGHLDPATGLVRDDFRGSDPLDHHLASGPYGQLIADALEGALRGDCQRIPPRPVRISFPG